MKHKFKVYCSALATMLMSATSINAGVSINELMPCNLSTYMNEFYNYVGWVELYNSDEAPVNLKGYSFRFTDSDSITSESKINYDCELKAEAYKLMYFDKMEGVQNHFPFKLDADGGKLELIDASGKVVNSIIMPKMYAHLSYGVNAGTWGYMNPTPKKSNETSYAKLERCSTPTFGTAPGLYDKDKTKTTTISSSSEGSEVYYTTDGSEPTKENGTLYSKEIEMTKSTVIRARAYAKGKLPSPIATGSYIMNDDPHKYCVGFTAPIVSIVTDQKNFYDDEIGICVVGTNGLEGDKECVKKKANYNQSWKRPVNFEYIVDGKPVISQETEASIMGGCSRKEENKVKALKISANKKCGSGQNKMRYQFFKDKDISKFKSLHVRNGGNAYDGLRFRDGFMQSLITKTEIDYQAFVPVAYYINGKYSGMMDLRERMDEDYLWSNYGLDEEDIDMISIGEDLLKCNSGTMDAYYDLIDALSEDPLTDEYYDNINKLMDINEYIEYQIFEQYIVNTDWPGNNTKIWRSKNNGRFRWMVYDTDFGFGLYGPAASNYTGASTNMIKFCKGEGDAVNWANGTGKGFFYQFDAKSEWKTFIFRQLMKNEKFRQMFLAKSMFYYNTILSTESVKAVWDSVSATAYGEYCAHNKPNEYWKQTYEKDDDANEILKFSEQRTGYALSHLAEEFGGKVVNLAIKSDNDNAMFIVNNEFWKKSSFSGNYISNNEIEIEPIAPNGWTFDHWELSSSASSNLLTNKSEWAYYYNSDMPAANWYEEKYDDAAWSTGHGKFGYANGGSYDTPLDFGDDSSNKYITSYFRNLFTIDDPDMFSKLVANVTYDDGIIVYVNGKELARFNMPEGEVNDSTVANEYVNDATESIEIPMSMLKSGSNVIAVEVHQNVVSSSDMTFALNLNAIGKSTGTTSKVKTYKGVVSDNMTMTAHFTKANGPNPIIINELCLSNHSEGGHADEYGHYGDWIELLNTGDESVNIAGMYITDNSTKMKKYRIPYTDASATTIKPGEHKLIWADEDTLQGALHIAFTMGVGKEKTVTLSYGDESSIIDRVVTPKELSTNQSYGRITDGSDKWTIFAYTKNDSTYQWTPGETNGSIVTDDIETTIDDYIALYPNPARDVIYIKSKNELGAEVCMIDCSGRSLRKTTLVSEDQQIDISDLNKGMYMIKITNQKEVKIMKFIKE